MSYGSRVLRPSTECYYDLLSTFIRQTRPQTRTRVRFPAELERRQFHDYFVTHLPSSSLHPDSRSLTGLAQKFSRKNAAGNTPDGKSATAGHASISRDTTVVRIPLKSAKHHYGAAVSRGSRPYNEDSHQAGIIEIPAFAKRPPPSITMSRARSREGTSADSASGDPQVFYFAVFDGHGGAECSDFLRASLHEYIEKSALSFGFRSSLRQKGGGKEGTDVTAGLLDIEAEQAQKSKAALDSVQISKDGKEAADNRSGEAEAKVSASTTRPPYPGDPPLIQCATKEKIRELEEDLTKKWKDLVGGYFRRFRPAYFSIYDQYQKDGEAGAALKESGKDVECGAAIEEVITYAFLKADYDFVAAQAAKDSETRDNARAERPLNEEEVLGEPSKLASRIGGPVRFKGGSTCSIALVSTPSATPFWNPATTSSMLVAHVGDTRILLCSTATGAAVPLTTNHHPSSPVESNRLRRYAATFVTDSFGEERISGLANTRAFGDIASKRIGVSAEPEIRRVELGPAEYSFMVLMSDGVSGTLDDQEVVDIVKEAKTPEQAARDVVNFATEVSTEGDNATCLVVRMGGWERRQEGGHGSLGTKESRDYKRQSAADPRTRRQ
ncbi:Protein phosphatase 2C 6 [Exophiala dermatitidis]|uniref:Protein phosphatase n=2 Tax=Exophiala dermatitidis TaxID=5970 RepID=H6BUC8_EXODN|nr:protein phosphatase [Exophiala dermatitidis NIH/UT8656]KAJ4508792.1 Protein phosphatase 2C 6 [Exophiala dermatitidis]EHY54858.1 protein phosphatase [Exophiala dermatitidis NIH/UT8656]KAJ4511032.1 Protein phosphatase 2C 6 [Exophiala dermatitidis]KAJ4538006.1 Protein phosphatase 2C 6 [Exophiala dermatitidis]KAJ4539737.1 Protein phosphatase 2C 6 [Exophiala dermatitidis]